MKRFVPPFDLDLFGSTTLREQAPQTPQRVSNKKPISIDKHLMPYIYRCAVGAPVANGPDTVVLRVNNKTAFGQYLHTVPLYANGIEIRNKKIQIEYNRVKKQALFLHYSFGLRYEITVDKSMNIILNRILEDMFRTEFMAYVLVQKFVSSISAAITAFIDKYELEECGFNVESLRVYFYKEEKRIKYFV